MLKTLIMSLLTMLPLPFFCKGGNFHGMFTGTEKNTVTIDTVDMVNKDFRIRKPAVSGSFYPSSPEELTSIIEGWLGEEYPDTSSRKPRAIIVPHAGYVFSGEVAASAYSRIPRDGSYKRIFLLGPSHRVGFAGASVDTLFSYAETPLGRVPIDREVGRTLVEKGNGVFTFREDAHDREHCLEVQLPFLQYLLDEVPPIVPIVIGTERLGLLRRMAEVLEPFFTDENLFIISSDFSHYPSYEDAKSSDLHMAETITAGGLEEFLHALSDIRKMGFPGQDTAACGACAIAVLLSMMDDGGRDSFEVEHLMYRNSGDSPYGDKDGVVGYNSFAIYASPCDKKEAVKDVSGESGNEDHIFHFTPEEKRGMISAARSAICSALHIEEDEPVRPEGILREKGYGVFVTLNLGGRLRGCIGRFSSSDTLYSTIREMALSAAFDDPRFPPLSRAEALAVEIEVSVLSPLKKIESIDEFKIGRDGIYMIKGSRHGTFLPQVAHETGWNTEEFLGHCAADKAGIGYYGWKDADLYTYQAEVVSESDIASEE